MVRAEEQLAQEARAARAAERLYKHEVRGGVEDTSRLKAASDTINIPEKQRKTR